MFLCKDSRCRGRDLHGTSLLQAFGLEVALCPPPKPSLLHSPWALGAGHGGRGVKTNPLQRDEKEDLSNSVACSGWAVIPSRKAYTVPNLTLWSLLERQWIWGLCRWPAAGAQQGGWTMMNRSEVRCPTAKHMCYTSSLPPAPWKPLQELGFFSFWLGTSKKKNASGEGVIMLVCQSGAQQNRSPDGCTAGELCSGITASLLLSRTNSWSLQEKGISSWLLLNTSIFVGEKEHFAALLIYVHAMVPEYSDSKGFISWPEVEMWGEVHTKGLCVKVLLSDWSDVIFAAMKPVRYKQDQDVTALSIRHAGWDLPSLLSRQIQQTRVGKGNIIMLDPKPQVNVSPCPWMFSNALHEIIQKSLQEPLNELCPL